MHTPKSKGVPQESPGLLRVIQPRVPKHQHGRRALWSPPRTRKAVRLRHSRLLFGTRPCICHRDVGCFYTVSFVIADVGVPKLSRVAGPPRESALDQKTLEGAVYGGRCDGAEVEWKVGTERGECGFRGWRPHQVPVSYTHLTLPTIYSV